MSNQETKKVHKKVALGRGLNSLLGGSEFDQIQQDKTVDKVNFKENETEVLKSGFVTEDVEVEVAPNKDKLPGKDLSRIWNISIEKVIPNKNQPRKDFDKEHLESLSLSIKEKGIIQPITVRALNDDQFEIMAGERRWRAAQLAGLHEVPVIIKENDDKEALEIALIENIQRQDLNPIEEAEAYFNLIKKYRLTQQQLAENLGKERATLANTLRLLNLSSDVRKLVSEGEISLGQAKVLLKVTDPKKQKSLAIRARDKSLSVRQIESLVDKSLAQEKAEIGLDQSEIQKISMVEELSLELQKLLGTKVSIDYKKGKGKISMNYYSDEELNNLVDKLRAACRN